MAAGQIKQLRELPDGTFTEEGPFTLPSVAYEAPEPSQNHKIMEFPSDTNETGVFYPVLRSDGKLYKQESNLITLEVNNSPHPFPPPLAGLTWELILKLTDDRALVLRNTDLLLNGKQVSVELRPRTENINSITYGSPLATVTFDRVIGTFMDDYIVMHGDYVNGDGHRKPKVMGKVLEIPDTHPLYNPNIKYVVVIAKRSDNYSEDLGGGNYSAIFFNTAYYKIYKIDLTNNIITALLESQILPVNATFFLEYSGNFTGYEFKLDGLTGFEQANIENLSLSFNTHLEITPTDILIHTMMSSYVKATGSGDYGQNGFYLRDAVSFSLLTESIVTKPANSYADFAINAGTNAPVGNTGSTFYNDRYKTVHGGTATWNVLALVNNIAYFTLNTLPAHLYLGKDIGNALTYENPLPLANPISTWYFPSYSNIDGSIYFETPQSNMKPCQYQRRWGKFNYPFHTDINGPVVNLPDLGEWVNSLGQIMSNLGFGAYEVLNGDNELIGYSQYRLINLISTFPGKEIPIIDPNGRCYNRDGFYISSAYPVRKDEYWYEDSYPSEWYDLLTLNLYEGKTLVSGQPPYYNVFTAPVSRVVSYFPIRGGDVVFNSGAGTLDIKRYVKIINGEPVAFYFCLAPTRHPTYARTTSVIYFTESTLTPDFEFSHASAITFPLDSTLKMFVTMNLILNVENSNDFIFIGRAEGTVLFEANSNAANFDYVYAILKARPNPDQYMPVTGLLEGNRFPYDLQIKHLQKIDSTLFNQLLNIRQVVKIKNEYLGYTDTEEIFISIKENIDIPLGRIETFTNHDAGGSLIAGMNKVIVGGITSIGTGRFGTEHYREADYLGLGNTGIGTNYGLPLIHLFKDVLGGGYLDDNDSRKASIRVSASTIKRD